MPEDVNDKGAWVPGITFRSLCATVCCMLLLGVGIQYAEVFQANYSAVAEQTVGIPALVVTLCVLLLSGLSVLISRRKLLTRAELLCVLYALLIATPLMTQGMWHRLLGIVAATPREGQFDYIDAMSEKLWPHGPNLVEGGLSREALPADAARGTVEWRALEVEAGQVARVPVLVNRAAGDVASVSLEVPRDRGGKTVLVPGEAFLLSVLCRPAELAPESVYFVRFHADGEALGSEVINERRRSESTYLHQRGFLRIGKYGVEVPRGVQRSLRIEFGLSGRGELALWDARFFSVAAVEDAYRGRRMISQADHERLPAAERGGLIVKPDRMWSLAGLKFLVAGYIPLADWVQPAIAWSALVALLLAGLFAVAVIMRRQWADSERYPFPLARIPCALIGQPEEDERPVWAAVWRNRVMWTGFAAGLFWGLLRMWAFYNPKVPDTTLNVLLKQYLSDPGWGQMWNVTFSVSAIVVSICIFFELNVLISIVLGFFAFRSLYWVGEFSGLKVLQGYPFQNEQVIGAYLAYAAIVLFFTRKYLWSVLRGACSRGGGRRDPGMPMGNRSALLLLAAVHIGVAAWAAWLGVSAGGMLAYFAMLMLMGFVAVKMRSESGLSAGYFTPVNSALLLWVVGGMTLFGPSSMLVCLAASGLLTASVFFFIPGVQFELLEYGRRYRVRPRHTALAALLGVAGGLFIGGWVFLSNSYAIGGDVMRFQWAYNQGWLFSDFRTQLAQATGEFARLQRGEAVATGLPPATWAFVYGAGTTALLAVLRQVFAGFWFHPIGFILGATYMPDLTWGSVLVAWAIRAVVLKFGGAATVKNRLFPFFVGVFLGSVLLLSINIAYAGYLQANGVEQIYNALP